MKFFFFLKAGKPYFNQSDKSDNHQSFIFIQTENDCVYLNFFGSVKDIHSRTLILQLLSISNRSYFSVKISSPPKFIPMDSEDNLSLHSSNVSSSHSDPQSSHNLSQNASSASSSSNSQNSQGHHLSEEMDRYDDNTIGFDSFSDCSDNPLNNGFIRNEDSFFSEYKSLYSCKSRFNQFSNPMDQNDIENPYESNSFSSFQSFFSRPEYLKQENGRKGSRDRSREKSKKSEKSSHGIPPAQCLDYNGVKRAQNDFKKRK